MDAARHDSWWPVAGGVLLLLLLAAGTGGGSLLHVHRVTAPGLPPQSAPPPPRPSAFPHPTATPDAAAPIVAHRGHLQDIVLTVLLVLLLVAAIAVAVLLVRRLVLLRSRPRRYAPTGPAALPGKTSAGPTPDVPDLVAAVAGAHASAAAPGSPRARVLGSWVGLEDAMAAGGRPRESGETAAELTRRVLGAHLADPAPLVELHGLYEHARYSPAEVTEAVPQRAADLLAEVRTRLEREVPDA